MHIILVSIKGDVLHVFLVMYTVRKGITYQHKQKLNDVAYINNAYNI